MLLHQLAFTFLALACFQATASQQNTRRVGLPVSVGCGKLLPYGQALGTVSNISISSGGFQRSYLVFIPPKYNAFIPTPLILSYHGGVRNAMDQLELDQLTSSEFNTRSIVVYPQGTNDTWQGVPAIGYRNDVQFTTDILDEVESLYCINPNRITVTGKSDGAGFNNILACDSILSKRIAAFAPVSGAYYIKTLPCHPTTVDIPCSAARSDIPMLAFHGGNDSTIPYLGGERKNECLPTIPHFIQEWAFRDGLDLDNVTTNVAANVTRYAFGHGAEAGLVELYYESNIGHDWPSTRPNADNTASGHHVANYNATPIIMSFFEAHTLSVSETIEEVL